MKLKVPTLRDAIREKLGGPLDGISREKFRKLANEAAEEIAILEDRIAAGAFECAVCGNVHYNWAPKDCRDAYNSDHF